MHLPIWLPISSQIIEQKKRNLNFSHGFDAHPSAAIQLCKVLGILHKKGRTRNDPEMLRKLLEERIGFGIEGFRRGGVVLTRRDMLELFSKTPESAGELYPLIQAELASLI